MVVSRAGKVCYVRSFGDKDSVDPVEMGHNNISGTRNHSREPRCRAAQLSDIQAPMRSLMGFQTAKME